MTALLIDGDPAHAGHIERILNGRGLDTSYAASIREAVRRLKCRAASIDLVVLAIGDRSQPWLEVLHQLQQAAWQAGIGDFPFFLCISRLNYGTEFQLRVERMGARLVIE
jgi:ActR/RegA family two-component response regulator